MLTENDVVTAVSNYLIEKGYAINQALTTSQQGIDIIATHPTHDRCLVEAKGATSSKKSSNRYGIEFNNNQIKTHVGVAILKSFQTIQLNKDAEVVIALPDNIGHRKIIDSMSHPIKQSGIKAIFVDENNEVEKYI